MTLNFACKTISIDQILSCSFGLSKTETAILKKMFLTNKPKTVQQISELLKKDRTTVQRSISRLLKKGIISRRQSNIDTGGYTFYYIPIDKQVVKQKILDNYNSFSKKLNEEIDLW